MRSFHLEDISPEVILSAQVPCPWKVIDLLILVYVLQLARFDKASPQYVPGTTRYQSIAGGL